MSALELLTRSTDELVVWKPAGVACEQRDPLAESVLSLLASDHPTAKLPHRLDRPTSGILLVCLTPEAIAFHGAQIKARRWDKYYLARVCEDPTKVLGRHRAFLVEDKGRARVVRSGGKPAWLELLASSRVPGASDRWHVLVHLLTGRFHQIRVMCAELGIPIAGDTLYGAPRSDDFYLEHILLKYTPFGASDGATVLAREHAARGPVDPSLLVRLDALAAAPATFEAAA